MFNIGGIFENWDALDTQNNFRKRATGIFAAIWNKTKLNKNTATKITTPQNLIDTVTYYNNNNVAREVAYPQLFGWRFENDSTFEGSLILTNISEDTITVSVDNLLGGEVNWEKWHSDSLFDVIDSVNYINVVPDAGTTNIELLPYSINVAMGECLSDIDSDGVCDELDNCPLDFNPNQEDFNSDNIGDICDGIDLNEDSQKKNLLIILDLLGKRGAKSSFQLHIYDDGSVEKKYILK